MLARRHTESVIIFNTPQTVICQRQMCKEKVDREEKETRFKLVTDSLLNNEEPTYESCETLLLLEQMRKI